MNEKEALKVYTQLMLALSGASIIGLLIITALSYWISGGWK